MAMVIKDGRGEYRAGACNIGPEEIAQRRRMGLVFLAIAIGLAAVLLAVDAPAWLRIAIWPPLAAAFTTLEQVRRRFCVAFGMAGVRNFGPEVGRAQRIEDDDARNTDRRTALFMAAYCSLAAAAVTALFVVLPS
ncbi:MAG: hypothetical protein ACJ77D_13925 [Chloroflexota bacterium]|jgi:hypothetical protein